MQNVLSKDIGYERYVRLKAISEEATISERSGYTLLDIGGHDELLKEFLPAADYTAYHEIISRTSRAPFPDGEFDVVVAADVLEHVRVDDREAFISEILRIAGNKLVFSFPAKGSEHAEELVLGFLPHHSWLQEHRENTLPDRRAVELHLEKSGYKFSVRPNHGRASWVYSILFDHLSLGDDTKRRLTSFMQQYCYEHENTEPAYRYIYTVFVG